MIVVTIHALADGNREIKVIQRVGTEGIEEEGMAGESEQEITFGGGEVSGNMG